jgi:hypothetical protein
MSAARDLTDDSSADTDAIYKCDTVPPPDGEDDAYSAPTRIWPMASAFIEQMMAEPEAASGVREVAAPRPVAKTLPLIDVPIDEPGPVPAPAALPLVAEDANDGAPLNPTSLFGHQQSGATMRIDVSLLRGVIDDLSRNGTARSPGVIPWNSTTDAPMPACGLESNRPSVRPAAFSAFSGTELAIAGIAFAACVLPALYFFFSRM